MITTGAFRPGLTSSRMNLRSVLVVDQDPEVHRSARVFLRTEGYQVETAMNGLEGIRQYRRYKPGIILVGMTMRGMGGFQFIEQLNKLPGQPRIIFSPEQDGLRFREYATKLGVEKYIPKPLSGGMILQSVSELTKA